MVYHGCRWVEEEIYISHDRNFQNRVRFITGYTKSSVLFFLCLFDFNMLRYFRWYPSYNKTVFQVEVNSRQNWNTLLATYLENFQTLYFHMLFNKHWDKQWRKILNYFYHFIMKLLLFCVVVVVPHPLFLYFLKLFHTKCDGILSIEALEQKNTLNVIQRYFCAADLRYDSMFTLLMLLKTTWTKVADQMIINDTHSSEHHKVNYFIHWR